MSNRDRINQIWESHPKAPFDALWHWAAGGKTKRERLDRFAALNAWALARTEWFKEHGWDAHTFWAAHLHYAKKAAWLRRHIEPKPSPVGDGWVNFDGHLVAGWMVRDALAPARASGTWNGSVFSGYRSPDYCRQLCINMCGAPSCPGRCAGTSSNHCGPPSFKGNPYEGAVDVTDYYGLRQWCGSHGWPIKGGGVVLPADLPHFSRNGN